MIHFLKGELVQKGQHPIREEYFWIIDVQGIGYYVLTTERGVLSSPPVEGDTMLAYTVQVVRQDDISLVGFLLREERDMFQMLQGASGVGTKVALSILSSLTVPEIAQAILAQEHKPLTRAKGVGPKLAQKIVLDLKEKMDTWRKQRPMASSHLTQGNSLPRPNLGSDAAQVFQEAETVLLSLGYTDQEIHNSLSALQASPDFSSQASSLTAEWVLREALKWLSVHTV